MRLISGASPSRGGSASADRGQASGAGSFCCLSQAASCDPSVLVPALVPALALALVLILSGRWT